MNERRSLQLLAEKYEQVREGSVYVSYNSFNLCEGDLRFVKKMSVEQAAEYFYHPKRLNNIEETTQSYSEDVGDPKPYRWYFPHTKQEFIERLNQNKFVIFGMDIPINDKILSIKNVTSTSLPDRPPEEIFEAGAYIVIHKDLPTVQHIIQSIVKFLWTDWD